MKIAHAHNSLATIVNQTKYYLGQMAIQQQQLTAQVSRISGAIHTIVKQVDSQERRINQLLIQSVEWFYQFIEVTPLWQDSKSLLYRMQLPL